MPNRSVSCGLAGHACMHLGFEYNLMHRGQRACMPGLISDLGLAQ